MAHKKELEELLIESDYNAPKDNILKRLFTLVVLILLICIVVYWIADIFAYTFVSIMPDKTQAKIEELFNMITVQKAAKCEYTGVFDEIKKSIIKKDKHLENKSKFDVYIENSKDINAYITPDGTIFITKGLLAKVKNKASLDFVIAHEMGHYANRDHLKGLAKELTGEFLLFVLTSGGNKDLEFIDTFKDFNSNSYSRRQEKNADIYAAKIIKEKYGNLNGAYELFKIFDQESDLPEFAEYFSTHPAPKQRIKYIKRIEKS